MTKHVISMLAGLAAALVGGYAGLFVHLVLTDLDRPGWAPVAILAGAGLVSAVVIGLIRSLSGSTVATLAGTAAVVGAALGLGVMEFRESLDVTVVVAIGLVTGLTLITGSMEPTADSQTRDRQHI